MFLAKLRCFRIFFLRITFSFVFVTKLHFHSLYYRKIVLLATKLGYFEPYVTKTSYFAFCVKNSLRLALLQEKHVLVCVPWNCAVSIDIAWERGFLLVCSESRRFLLDFIKATFFGCLLQSYAVFSIIFFRAAIFSVFLPKTCFGFF